MASASTPEAGSIALANPKSSTFTVPSGRNLDVGGLQIAMDDALLVRRFERLGDLPSRSASASSTGTRAPSAMRSASVGALDELQHERVRARR